MSIGYKVPTFRVNVVLLSLWSGSPRRVLLHPEDEVTAVFRYVRIYQSTRLQGHVPEDLNPRRCYR